MCVRRDGIHGGPARFVVHTDARRRSIHVVCRPPTRDLHVETSWRARSLQPSSRSQPILEPLRPGIDR